MDMLQLETHVFTRQSDQQIIKKKLWLKDVEHLQWSLRLVMSQHLPLKLHSPLLPTKPVQPAPCWDQNTLTTDPLHKANLPSSYPTERDKKTVPTLSISKNLFSQTPFFFRSRAAKKQLCAKPAQDTVALKLSRNLNHPPMGFCDPIRIKPSPNSWHAKPELELLGRSDGRMIVSWPMVKLIVLHCRLERLVSDCWS